MAVCNVCGDETETLQDIAEQYVLDLIKKDHPEWVESSGACSKCVEYYKSLSKVVIVDNKTIDE